MEIQNELDYDEQGREVQVVYEDSEYTESPVAIEVLASNAIAFIIYDPSGKKALGGVSVDPKIENFESTISTALSDLGDPDNLRIYLGGATPEVNNPDDQSEAIKDFTIKTLYSWGFKPEQITVKWLRPNQSGTVKLDTETGEVEFKYRNDWELSELVYCGPVTEEEQDWNT